MTQPGGGTLCDPTDCSASVTNLWDIFPHLLSCQTLGLHRCHLHSPVHILGDQGGTKVRGLVAPSA